MKIQVCASKGVYEDKNQLVDYTKKTELAGKNLNSLFLNKKYLLKQSELYYPKIFNP